MKIGQMGGHIGPGSGSDQEEGGTLGTVRKVGMKEETGARWNEKLEGQEERQTEKIKQEGDRNRKGCMEKKDKRKVGQIGGGPRRSGTRR